MQSWKIKILIGFAAGILLFGFAVCPAQAAFTSLYIFGDTVSSTTDSPGGSDYYGNRYSNGRVWVEVLAQQLGLTNNYWYSTNSSNPLSYTNLSASSTNWSYSSNNNSYYDHNSALLVPEVNSFSAPTNATNALFIVWVNDADFVDILNQTTPILISPPYTTAQLPQWTNVFNLSLTNHFQVITNLYAKGARTLIMPNAVDLTKVPGYAYYLNSSNALFFRQRVMAFNAAFANTLNSAKASCPGLTIYVPDFFALLDNVVSNSANYGLTNALDANGLSIGAREDSALTNKALNGPGTNYIFWDYEDPSAKFHAVLADVAQQLISPARITNFTVLTGSNRLDVASLPIGLNGFVDGSTNLVLANWVAQTNFNSTNATQSIFVPASGPVWFYRLRFPFAWSWP
jgi:phospholipase/lecithinase/hemolysin